MKRPTADEARDMILAIPAENKTERVPIAESLGRVLAEDIYSSIPVPPFDRSPFDGYAFRGEDTVDATAEKPCVLRITGNCRRKKPRLSRLQKGMRQDSDGR
jgi:molybdopterin molybdotransferase